MKNLAYDDILNIYNAVQDSKGKISSNTKEIEFTFNNEEQKKKVETICTGLVQIVNTTPTALSILNSDSNTLFFDNLNSLLDKISLDVNLVSKKDLFVFDYDSHFLHYDSNLKESKTNSETLNSFHIISHFVQYTKLLNLYLRSKGRLYEIERELSASSELVILSKGELKLITSVSYKKIDKSIFVDDCVSIPLEVFEGKLISDEWLACFNNTLCQFMDLQTESRRTFSNLYNNFIFIFNQTEKNYNLFITKFSFVKIRKQFKVEKNSYFDNLNLAQDKISGQIISIPLTLGASIISFYQFKASENIIALVYLAILIYSIFIGYVVTLNLYDIKKIAVDANEEMKNLIKYFPDVYSDVKEDFVYMKNKRIRVRILAWSIIAALLITLISITIFILNYNYLNINSIHLI